MHSPAYIKVAGSFLLDHHYPPFSTPRNIPLIHKLFQWTWFRRLRVSDAGPETYGSALFPSPTWLRRHRLAFHDTKYNETTRYLWEANLSSFRTSSLCSILYCTYWLFCEQCDSLQLRTLFQRYGYEIGAYRLDALRLRSWVALSLTVTALVYKCLGGWVGLEAVLHKRYSSCIRAYKVRYDSGLFGVSPTLSLSVSFG